MYKRQEIEQNVAAQKAVDKEWDRLRAKHVWDETHVREWSDVVAEARAANKEVHMGYLFGICVLKNSELDDNDERNKYKYRVVFQGNRVVNQHWEQAVFQDMGSSPATMEASRAADAYGCAPGHDIEIADAEQAYIQAEMQGTETWVCLPPEARPKSWKGMHRPVVRLLRALYGHPDAGTFWEEHCDQSVKRAGFRPVHETWPSCYYHKDYKLFLVVYVDDFKLSGPKQYLKKGWELLRRSINIEPEQPLGLYLGCQHEKFTMKLLNGTVATAIRYNMEKYLRQTVQRFKTMAGTDTVLKHAATPFIPEDHKVSPQGGPATGPVQECPWCKHTFPPVRTFDNIDQYEAWKRQEKDSRGTPVPPSKDDRGRLQPIASSILMGLLYAARYARFDILRAIGHLACHVTRWSSTCDSRLHRLVNYTHSSYEQRMVGWIGDALDCICLLYTSPSPRD